MSKKPHKPYDQMNAAELAEATKEYDREQLGTPGRPLTKRDRELHRKAKKMGRPKKGAGSIVIGVSIERGLLKQADALAKRRKVGRSALVVAAIQDALARAEETGGHIPMPRVEPAAKSSKSGARKAS